MGTPWNPNHPERVGPEFLAELTRSWTVGSTGGASNGISQKWRSTAADSNVSLGVFASAVTGSGYLLAEVVEDGDEEWVSATVTKIQPATAFNNGNFSNQAGSMALANLIASIDDTVDPSDLSDYIEPALTGIRQSLDIQFNAGQVTAATAGQRVLGVTVGIRAMPRSSADKTDVYNVRIVEAATGDVLRSLDRVVPSNQENWFNLGELWTEDGDPDAAKPWDEATLLELCTGGDYYLRIGTGGGDGIKLSRMRLVVATTTEARVGVAVFNEGSWDLSAAIVGAGQGDWSESLPLLTPDSSGGIFDKANATTYRTIYRRAWTGNDVNSLNVTLPVVSRHDSALPPADTYLDDPLLLAASSVVGPSTALTKSTIASVPRAASTPSGGAVQPVGVLPVRLVVAAADDADGQTYVQVVPAVVEASSGPINQYVTTGADGSQDYTALRVAIGFANSSNLPTDDLTVTIKDAAGVVTLGTGSISKAAYQAGPLYTGPLVMRETIVDVEATLAASTQYRIVLDSDTDDDAGWLVGVLSSRGGEGSGVSATWPDGAATYGGVTDKAFTHPDVATVACDDLSGYLSLALASVTDFTVTADALAFDGASQPCGIDTVPYAVLEWTEAGLDALFAQYRLQRRDEITDEWEDIAYLTNEPTQSFWDFEARLVLESEWRIRTEGITGQVSVWSDPVAESLPASGCGYTFTTNWLPLDAIAYKDVYDSRAIRGYDFPDADEVLVRTFAGRDEFVVFRPTERRSVRFSRELLTRAFRGPSAGVIGPAAFDLLRDLAKSTMPPYIAVRDEQGNRWYAGVIVRSGSVQMPAKHHKAVIEVVPVSTIATPPTITN